MRNSRIHRQKPVSPNSVKRLSQVRIPCYDSAGIAVRDGDSPVQVVKAKGRLKVLAEKTNDGQSVIGTCGIRSIQDGQLTESI